MTEKCVCCGVVIPEGRQICPKCEVARQELEAYRALGTIEKLQELLCHDIKCNACRTKIGKVKVGYVEAGENYNVCERCGAEVCGHHAVEYGPDYWVCPDCEKILKFEEPTRC